MFLDGAANRILVCIHDGLVLAPFGRGTEFAGLLGHLQTLLDRERENFPLPGFIADPTTQALVFTVIRAQGIAVHQ